MASNKALGTDFIVSYWLENLTCLHENLMQHMKSVMVDRPSWPSWLSTIMAIIMAAKNGDTHFPNISRPIACQITTYELYAGSLHLFLEDRCQANDIIVNDQAGAKKGSWGCMDQFLRNRMVLEEVGNHKCNLITIWFDYKKVFSSVSHHVTGY